MKNFLWIFDYDAILALVPACSLLFILGGGGVKPLRRAGIAVLIVAVGFYYEISAWRVFLSAALMGLFLSEPYGDSLRKRFRGFFFITHFAIGFLYGAAVLPLSSGWMPVLVCPVVTSLTFGTLTFTSQKFDFPRWKWVELITGSAIGFALMYALGGRV